MNDTKTEKSKKKMGRPPKAKKGAMVWVPDYSLDAVKAFLSTMKQQHESGKSNNEMSST